MEYGPERDEQDRQKRQSYQQIFADSVILYEGYDEQEASRTFLYAGKHGARYVSRFVDGVRVTFSQAIAGA